MAKINKSLDLNKLFTDQSKGKLLRKNLVFPMYGSIKYDGNYVVVLKEADKITYITSGGHIYTHDKPTIFDSPYVSIGAYIAERIVGEGKLGDRTKCSLRGPRGNQVAYGHDYKVHHIMELEDYHNGESSMDYEETIDALVLDSGIDIEHRVEEVKLHNQDEVETFLKNTVAQGYEGIMLKNPYWVWKDTKSRTVDCVKYKKRPTADLLVIDVLEGEVGKKYEGMIGSLRVRDSKGRTVDVGSGMSDEERLYDPSYFMGKVVEVFYEQIIDTYIQPTFGDEYDGVLIRHDKSTQDID